MEKEYIPVSKEWLHGKLDKLEEYYSTKTEDDIRRLSSIGTPACPSTVELLTYMDYINNVVEYSYHPQQKTNPSQCTEENNRLDDEEKIYLKEKYDLLNHWLRITRKYLYNEDGYRTLANAVVAGVCREYILDRHRLKYEENTPFAKRILKRWIYYFSQEMTAYTDVDPEQIVGAIDHKYGFRQLMGFKDLVNEVKREIMSMTK
mgnify:CR=1 FL=1